MSGGYALIYVGAAFGVVWPMGTRRASIRPHDAPHDAPHNAPHDASPASGASGVIREGCDKRVARQFFTLTNLTNVEVK
jgi:hypothetical protein